MKTLLALLLLIPNLSLAQILACKSIEPEKSGYGTDYFELDGDNLVLISTNMMGLTLELSHKNNLSNHYTLKGASGNEYWASLNKHDLEMIFNTKNSYYEYESRIIYACELSKSIID